MNKNKIISVAQVILKVQPILYKLIKLIQIDVRKQLRNQITDWQASKLSLCVCVRGYPQTENYQW